MRQIAVAVLFGSCVIQCSSFQPSSSLLQPLRTHEKLPPSSPSPSPSIGSTKPSFSSALFASKQKDDKPTKEKKQRRNPLLVLTSKFARLSRKAKAVVLTQILLVVLLFGFASSNVISRPDAPVELQYSQFMDLVEGSPAPRSGEGQMHVVNVKIASDKIGFQLVKSQTEEQRKAIEEIKQGRSASVALPSRNAFTRKVSASPQLVQYLREHKVPFAAASSVSSASLLRTAIQFFLTSFYLLFMWRMYRTMTGASGGTGGGPGKLASPSKLSSVKFEDIQGIDKAKFEVMELVDTLRNPGKYAILGARAPKGLLLEGPPGTGKTLLARATAVTAGVPLLSCSGSDFVEMFVGRGASRVRKIFEKAQKIAPALIFIDELDALGKSREGGTGLMSSMRNNDEAEQTLNQLLACMDGLDSNESQICVVAATNRREVLDSALLRPGRFDRIVRLELPDADGREAILRVYASKLPGFEEGTGVDPRRLGSFGVGSKIDLSAIAAATPGLSGAELEVIVNEAAIRAVRRVSAALRDGTTDPGGITPSVQSSDFEESLKSFFESRKKNNGGLGDLFKTYS